MAKFCVLRINRFGKLTTYETYHPTKDDYSRAIIKIIDTTKLTYELKNDYGWIYKNNTKALYDKNGNKLVVNDKKIILQIINFFPNLNEAIESLFTPSKKTTTHVECLVDKLLKNQKRKFRK